MHPLQTQRVPYITRTLDGAEGPALAVTDWMAQVPEQISRWVPQPFSALGTDGFGRSETRESLRRHFQIDAESIVIGVLHQLVAAGAIDAKAQAAAIERYGIDPESTTDVP